MKKKDMSVVIVKVPLYGLPDPPLLLFFHFDLN